MAPVYSILDIEQRINRHCHYLRIPKALLPVDTQLYLTADPSRCLLLFGDEIWDLLRDKLMSLSQTIPGSDPLKRLLIGNAREVFMNTKHRLELPVELAEFARLEMTAYWVQTRNNIVELWNPDLFNEAKDGSWLDKQLTKKATG
ncbi:division/cell wall cluster transcriptional repressor MraZ [Propionivibrio sp.]|uniref:division/cell wall cluster transcriptional repressor MraZ n=1 Tax=Propionivibrio sp. TaxID=2212460 RepID=UPI003BF3907C